MLAKLYRNKAKEQIERYSSLKYQIPVVEFICNTAAYNGQWCAYIGFSLEPETINFLLNEGFLIENLNPEEVNNYSYHIIKW